MDNNRKLLVDKVVEAEKEMRNAIRWLAEAERFKIAHSNEKWKGAAEEEIALICEEVYVEALKHIISSRKLFVECRRQLMEFDKRNK